MTRTITFLAEWDYSKPKSTRCFGEALPPLYSISGGTKYIDPIKNPKTPIHSIFSLNPKKCKNPTDSRFFSPLIFHE